MSTRHPGRLSAKSVCMTTHLREAMRFGGNPLRTYGAAQAAVRSCHERRRFGYRRLFVLLRVTRDDSTGIVAPFSGSAKELGRQMKLGIETVFSLVNEAGGVNGRQLKLFSADD